MEFVFISAAAAFLFAIVIAALIALAKNARHGHYIGHYTVEPPHRAAGRRGEIHATQIIKSVLREGDSLFTNVFVSFDGRPTELDDVIVNEFGVFIIEVKNYSGNLYGAEEDSKWTKVHVSRAGNSYVKTVDNPISQVKREVYLLARYLDYYGVSVWVDGYAMILGATSPVVSRYMLSNVSDIDRAIHTPGKQRLRADTLASISRLLS